MAGLLPFPTPQSEYQINRSLGVPMARKPNYGFERREREKAKAEKKAERLKARQERQPSDEAEPNSEAEGTTTADPE
jgi:hypothetical protein